jgi:NADPH2:quinone reductase
VVVDVAVMQVRYPSILSAMRAVVFERKGGPEVMDYKEVPDPSPDEGRVLVRIEAIGVNFRDVYERSRDSYGAQPPSILGVEGAGTIADTDEHVAWVGVPASYAELAAADRDRLVPVPEGVSSELAAAAMLQGMTAHYLAFDSYPIEAGDWVVVHAAAGGVGLLLTQLAKLRQGRVIATTSTDEKAVLAREAGADEVIGYDGFAERVKAITGGEGAAAIYDGVGKTTFLEGFKALRPTGRMILYGSASGQPDPLDVGILGAGSYYVQRPVLGAYTRTPELLRERADQLLELIRSGKLDVRIGARYPLAEARRAHEDLEARQTTGKLLLIP